MKKNLMSRIASGLLVAVLLTTCVISGTFAKYVTSGTAGDTARVAKWGVTVVTAADGLFADTYATDTTAVKSTIALSVDSAGDNGDDVVAPGTSGEGASVTITGSPEVAVQVKYEATVELSDWELTYDLDEDGEDDTFFYCPLVITVNDEDYCGLDYESAEDFAAAILAEINSSTGAETNGVKNYAANTNLASQSIDLAISWSWAFTGTTGSEVDQTDVLDTMLGNIGTDTITINYTVSVTQID